MVGPSAQCCFTRELITRLGHELRNPLAPMASAVELIRARIGSQVERELDVIERQLRQLVRVLDGLVDGADCVDSQVACDVVAPHDDGRSQGAGLSTPVPSVSAMGVFTPQAPPVAKGAPPTRILVVDDNIDAAELLAEVLRLRGYDVYSAFDAESAIVLAARVLPSVAILDIGLPDIDGYELARRLRMIDGLQGIRLIAATGYDQDSDRENSRAAGFHVHLTKPVYVHTMVGLIENQAALQLESSPYRP